MLIINNKPFYWLKYSNLLEDLPILKIKSNDVLKRRLNKLIKCDVLEFKLIKEGGVYSYFAVGKNYIKLIADDPTEKSEGADSKVGTLPTQKSGPPDSKVGTNNPSTKYSSTKDNISCGTDQSVSTEKVPYEKIIDLFNSTCKSLPKVMARNKTRDKRIKTMYKAIGMENIKQAFLLTENSDYLSGRNGKWLNCSFDWVIKESNYTKILEGNYNRNSKVINMPIKQQEQSVPVEINKDLLGDL